MRMGGNFQTRRGGKGNANMHLLRVGSILNIPASRKGMAESACGSREICQDKRKNHSGRNLGRYLTVGQARAFVHGIEPA